MSSAITPHLEHFTGGPIAFGDAPADTDRIPVKMLIRSHEGVERLGRPWYHDFASMEHKPHVPIDWQHDPERVIGYLDRFEVRHDGLHARGALIAAGDASVRTIATRARGGVPYESSIFFDPIEVEEVSPGRTARVNGRTLEGPAVVFRRWRLRGVAICPYGADTGTETRFMSLSDVASRWGLSPRTVRRVVDRGELVATKLGGSIRIAHGTVLEYEAWRKQEFRNAVGVKLAGFAAAIRLPEREAAVPEDRDSAAREQRLRQLGHRPGVCAFAKSLQLSGRRGQ